MRIVALLLKQLGTGAAQGSGLPVVEDEGETGPHEQCSPNSL
jgi:hypothetical protein